MSAYCRYYHTPKNVSSCDLYSYCRNCSGREVAVKCVYGLKYYNQKCNKYNYISIIESEGCVNGSLRLIGGNTMLEGILQICIDGVWGVICGYQTTKEMRIACAQMGFSPTGISTYK